jgi:hypothetical protein
MDPSIAAAPTHPTRAALAFGSPRKLPKASDLHGRVVVLDIAFAYDTAGSGSAGFDKLTGRLIKSLGSRLAAWVDHHDHALHARFAADPRFVLTTKAEHPACPELVTPALVERVGKIDTIVCHTDFDGLCSAAKWLRGGVEPYAGADADARAIDSRVGTPSAIADRFDRALRGRPHDEGLFGVIVRHLSLGLADAGLWAPIDAAASEYVRQEQESRRLASGFERLRGAPHGVAYVEVPARPDGQGPVTPYDKTLLLLLGQEREPIAVVVDRDSVSLAAAFDSGINFLALLELSGGMPTRVSVPRARLTEVFDKLGVRDLPSALR